MIEKVRKAAEWLGDLAEKAKAVAGAVAGFTAVVTAATADDVLGLDEIPTIITAGITAGTVIYYIIWRTPNEGFIKAGIEYTHDLSGDGEGRPPLPPIG